MSTASRRIAGRRLTGRLTMLAAALAGAFIGNIAFSAPASADFRVCNGTDNLVGVAIGLRGRSGWVTEGWWHIEGSSCKTLLEGPLSSRYYYLYAEDAEQGGRWAGPIDMCIANREFKIVGVNDCFARGYERAGFQEHDTGDQINWMVQLSDEMQPDRMMSDNAPSPEPVSSSSQRIEDGPEAGSGPAAADPAGSEAGESESLAPAQLGDPDVTPALGDGSDGGASNGGAGAN